MFAEDLSSYRGQYSGAYDAYVKACRAFNDHLGDLRWSLFRSRERHARVIDFVDYGTIDLNEILVDKDKKGKKLFDYMVALYKEYYHINKRRNFRLIQGEG